MIFKMIKSSALTSAFVALSCATLGSVGCGEDEKDKTGGGGEEDAGGATGGDNTEGNNEGTGGDGTYDVSFTLVPILAVDDSAPITTPHKVVALNSVTGEDLDPAVTTTTESGTGKFTLKGLPEDTAVAIYVAGVGPVETTSSTYDTMLLNFNPKAGDPLFRISSVGTYTLAASTGGFEAKDDRAALSGGIYWAPGGKRSGTVGCAKVCLDGKLPGDDVDVRYIAASGLPTTPDKQDQTIRSGRFYVGNLTEGSHKIAASLDDCKTILGKEIEFFVPFSRAEAQSDLKAVLLQMGIDVDVKANPTSSTCKD